jgi:hypothetical protein
MKCGYWMFRSWPGGSQIFRLLCCICVYLIWRGLLLVAFPGPPFTFLIFPFPSSYPVFPHLHPLILLPSVFIYFIAYCLFTYYFFIIFSFSHFSSSYASFSPPLTEQQFKGPLVPHLQKGPFRSHQFPSIHA